jgi:hypothetical protein
LFARNRPVEIGSEKSVYPRLGDRGHTGTEHDLMLIEPGKVVDALLQVALT